MPHYDWKKDYEKCAKIFDCPACTMLIKNAASIIFILEEP